MNILVLSHQSPLPANHGFAQRVLSQAKALAHRGHSIWIVGPSNNPSATRVKRTVPDDELENLTVIEVPQKERMIKPARRLVGALFGWQDSPGILKEALKLHARHRIDLVQLERPYLLSTARILKKMKIPLVLISHVVEQDSALDLEAMGEYTPSQVRAAVSAERSAVELADLTLAVSQADALRLEGLYGGRRGGFIPSIEVMVNGVDCSSYSGIEPQQFSYPTVVFLGSGFHYPNRDAMWRLNYQIIPKVQKLYRGVEFVFIGPNPPEWLKSRPGVRVLGAVDDVKPYLLGASVCVAPLRKGTGTPLKMLEYMAASKAIVASPHASRAFHLHDGEHALVRSTVDDFSKAIVEILRKKDVAKRLGRAAFALCHEQYDWSMLVKRLEKTYERFLA